VKRGHLVSSFLRRQMSQKKREGHAAGESRNAKGKRRTFYIREDGVRRGEEETGDFFTHRSKNPQRAKKILEGNLTEGKRGEGKEGGKRVGEKDALLPPLSILGGESGILDGREGGKKKRNTHPALSHIFFVGEKKRVVGENTKVAYRRGKRRGKRGPSTWFNNHSFNGPKVSQEGGEKRRRGKTILRFKFIIIFNS